MAINEGQSVERNPTELELPPAIVTSQTQFEIPFRTDDLNGRLVEVQLYVSTDLGLTWNVYARQSPMTTRIPFQSVGDGEYLFALKTLDRDGRLLPTGPPIPTLRMVIDTVQPELSLRVEPDKSGRIAITWRSTDQNLDKSTLRLSYRSDGPNLPNQWQPLGTGSPATADQSADATLYQDRVTWFPDAVAETIILKAEIQDFAGNLVTSYQPVGLGNLRSAIPSPLLQGGQANSLTPPNPNVSGSAAATTQPKPASSVLATNSPSNPSAPIDWPASQPSSGASSGASSGGQSPSERVPAKPAHWTRGSVGLDATAQTNATNPSSDPFRQMLADPATPLGPIADPTLDSANISIAIGTTIRQPIGPTPAAPENVVRSEMTGHAHGSVSVPSAPASSGSVSVPHPTPAYANLPAVRLPVSGPESSGESGGESGGSPERTEARGVGFSPIRSDRPSISAAPPSAATLDPKVAFFNVNSLQFRLRFQVDGLQPNQIGAVTIFGSRDMGASWELWTEDRDKTSPVEINVPSAGRYAFRVVVTSISGSTSRIPRSGDEPEVVVDVDLDPPSPRIVAVPYGRNSQPASLLIQWSCDAADLGATPVALAYSHAPTGPWTSITSAAVNTGEFEWMMQPNLPPQVYLQLVVTDKAGNRGVHTLDAPIDIGPLLPRGRILGLDR
ncbi:MAG: hypothetical protein Q8M16_06565 [Pirellulaceae bacterium]|nr:hypothetical protein [Pirellulaceae bacterium]